VHVLKWQLLPIKIGKKEKSKKKKKEKKKVVFTTLAVLTNNHLQVTNESAFTI
jgi:hypothetical protein